MAIVQYTCPKCGSENMQKASVIYEAGTTTGIVSGIATDGDGDMGVAMGRSTRSSLLAKRLAPPNAPSCVWIVLWLILTVCGGVAVYILSLSYAHNMDLVWGAGLGTFISLAMAGASIAGYLPKSANYPAQLKAWESQWYCLKCGSLWLE